jgi:hypothetical protein
MVWFGMYYYYSTITIEEELIDYNSSARDTETDQDVAIKKIFNIFEHDKEYQKRILREGTVCHM